MKFKINIGSQGILISAIVLIISVILLIDKLLSTGSYFSLIEVLFFIITSWLGGMSFLYIILSSREKGTPDVKMETAEIPKIKSSARNQDILLIFLFNAAFIGLIGGIIGIILGTMLSGFMPALMGGLPMARGTAIVTLKSITMALSVSVIVGILAGMIPAYQASKLKPVDALRYE